MKRALVLLGFGLSPLWAAAVLAWYLITSKPSYAIAAPWLFVVAVPATAVTLGIAGLSFKVHAIAGGSPRRKALAATAFILTASLLMVFVALAYWGNRQDEQALLRAEEAAVETFVETESAVIAQVGEPKQVSVVTYTIPSSSSLPVEYEVKAEGTSVVYAIVAVTRNNKNQRFFALSCTTPIYFGHRDASRHPCRP